MEGIEGHIHVITGGYGGIATATAEYLSRNGAIVVLTGRDLEKGNRATANLRTATGGQVHFLRLDVTDSGQVEDCVQEIEATIGPVHGVVINAATARLGAAFDHTDEDWRSVLSVTLEGAFYCARSFGKAMQERGGSIVLVSSIASRTGVGPHVAYSSAKAGVSHLARVLGVEWANMGVRVNAVEPGYTATNAIAHLERDAPEVAARLLSNVPIGRFLQPIEIAHAIAFLLSDLSSAMTGSVLIADGGASAR